MPQLARRLLARLGVERFDKRGIATDVASAAVLGFVGDIVCQQFVEGKRISSDGSTQIRWRRSGDPPLADHEFDARRLCALTAFSSVYIGGFLYFLYQLYPVAVVAVASRAPAKFARWAEPMLRRDCRQHAFGCAVVDNLHCAVLYTPAYFLAVGVLEGERFADAARNLASQWAPTYASATGFWIPFMWFNFAYVPAERRVQAMAVANLFWNVIIDFLAHRGLSE